MSRKPLAFLKSILLPVLSGLYPVLFLYSHNVTIVDISSLVMPLLIMTLIAFLAFGLFWLFQRDFVNASSYALIFLISFHMYGIVYSRLANNDYVQIEHYTLLPTFILFSVYGGFLMSKLPKLSVDRVHTVLLLVVCVLVLYNIALAVPSEIQKGQLRASTTSRIQSSGGATASYPDVYFIIFDEYAGFDALREYWKYDGYREFQSFLEQRGFFVAEHSHSRTISTLIEIASRLNLKEFGKEYLKHGVYLFDDITDNKVMRIFKSYGYTTVVFDGVRFHYETKPQMTADFNMTSDDFYVPTENGFVVDEFATLFFDQSMLSVFSNFYSARELANNPNRKMIFYSLVKVLDLNDIPTPKFVYLHVMLPHSPMMFDENGESLNYIHRADWNYYLGQHKYTTKRAIQLVDQLLKEADPDLPPIIILQSDHGARNYSPVSSDTVLLENYDDRYKTSILNALYLPGYEYSQLTDDLEPIRALEIVLNHYLDAGVTIEKLLAE